MFSNKQEKLAAEELKNISNIIGKGTVLVGNLEAYGNIRIEGKITGNLKSKNKVAMGQSSHVEGDIMAQNAEIAGEVKGRLEVSELLILKPTAVINGDIITNKLLVETGAVFNGSCQMGVSMQEILIGQGQSANNASKGKEEEVKTA